MKRKIPFFIQSHEKFPKLQFDIILFLSAVTHDCCKIFEIFRSPNSFVHYKLQKKNQLHV